MIIGALVDAETSQLKCCTNSKFRAGDHAQTGKLKCQTNSREEPLVDESAKVEYLGMDGEARQLYFNFIDGPVEIRNTNPLLEMMFRSPT